MGCSYVLPFEYSPPFKSQLQASLRNFPKLDAVVFSVSRDRLYRHTDAGRLLYYDFGRNRSLANISSTTELKAGCIVLPHILIPQSYLFLLSTTPKFVLKFSSPHLSFTITTLTALLKSLFLLMIALLSLKFICPLLITIMYFFLTPIVSIVIRVIVFVYAFLLIPIIIYFSATHLHILYSSQPGRS